ncbi:MAG: hypothetical protein MZV63_57205 [Marinilabiliales bacterium]|nr:hypothetical protein [Marinilabiliales bacterium]
MNLAKKQRKKHNDRLLDPEYEDDEEIEERLRTIKKKIQDHDQNIEIIENKLIERDTKSRVARNKQMSLGNITWCQDSRKQRSLFMPLSKKLLSNIILKKTGKVDIS